MLSTRVENTVGKGEMAESYPERVENTLGKREIARYEQFLLFPLCFRKACLPGASKDVILWGWVKRAFRRSS